MQADGSLGATPTFQTPEDWCLVYVRDEAIIPSETYEFRVDSGTPGNPVLSDPAYATTWIWGDTNGDEAVNVQDINNVLAGYQGNFTNIILENVDVAPPSSSGCAAPNGVVILEDLMAVMGAYQGAPFPCPDPCP